MSSGRYGYAAGYAAPQQPASNAGQAPSQYPSQGGPSGYASYGQASQTPAAYASGHAQQPSGYARVGQQQQQQQQQQSQGGSYGHHAASQAYQVQQHPPQQQHRQTAYTQQPQQQQQPATGHGYEQSYRQSTYDPRQQPRQAQAPTAPVSQAVYVTTSTTAPAQAAYVVQQPNTATVQAGQRVIAIPGLTVIPGVTTSTQPTTAYVLHSQAAQDMDIEQPQQHQQPHPTTQGYAAASHGVGYAPGYTAPANARPMPVVSAAGAIGGQPAPRSDTGGPGARQGSRWAPQAVQPSQPQHPPTGYMETGGRAPQGFGHQQQPQQQPAYGHPQQQQPQAHGFGGVQSQQQGYQQAVPAYKQGQSGYETVPYPESGAGRTSGFSKTTYPATADYYSTTPMVREREPDRRPHGPMDAGKRGGGAGGGGGRDAARDNRPGPRRDDGAAGARGFSYDARAARTNAPANREPMSRRVDRERERSKERERAPPAVTAHAARTRRSRSCSREKPTAATSPRVGTTRKRSPSPVKPKVAEYSVKIPSFSFCTEKRDYSELMRRYSKLTLPFDFASLTASWTQLPAFGQQPTDSLGLSTVILDKPARFEHDLDHETQANEPDILTQDLHALPQPHTDGVCYAVRVLLLQGINSTERDSIARGAHRDTGTHMAHALRFVTARYVHPKHKRGVLGALGGFWEPTLDGPNPTDQEGLKAAAVRHVRQQTGLDLSSCSHWYRICDIQYLRSVPEKQNGTDQHSKSDSDNTKSTFDRPLTVVMYCVVASDLMPSQSDWPAVHAGIEAWRKHQLTEGQERKSTTEEQQQQQQTESTEQQNAAAIGAAQQQQQNAEEQQPMGEAAPANILPGGATDVHTAVGDVPTVKEEANPDAHIVKIEVKSEAKEEAQATGIVAETAPTSEPAPPPSTQLPPPYIHIKGQHTSTFKVRTASTTLYSLLDYDEDDSAEPTFELCCFAECFHEIMMRDYACVIMSHLSNGRYPREVFAASHGSSQEQAAGEMQEKETESVLSPPAKKPRNESSHRTNMPLLFAFRYFDRTGCSYLKPEDLKRMLHNIGTCLPNRIIKQLVANASGRKTDKIYYRELTDTIPESSKSEDTKDRARRSESRDDVKGSREGAQEEALRAVEALTNITVPANGAGDAGQDDTNMNEENEDVPAPLIPPPPPSAPPPLSTETVVETTLKVPPVLNEPVAETASEAGGVPTIDMQTAELTSHGADTTAEQLQSHDNDTKMQDGDLQGDTTAGEGQEQLHQEDVLDYIEIEIPIADGSDEDVQHGEGEEEEEEEGESSQDEEV